MRKEFKLLFASHWQAIFFITLVIVGVVIANYNVKSPMGRGVLSTDIDVWQGPFTDEKLEKARNTPGITPGSFGIETLEPEAAIATTYIESYNETRRLSQVLTRDAPDSSKEQVRKILAAPEYFHIPTWYNLFLMQEPGSGSSQPISIFFLALVILVSNLVNIEYREGTFLVTTGTLGGRKGMLRNKFFVVFIVALVFMFLILLASLISVINSGEMKYAHVDIADAMHKVNIWDTSLLGGFFISSLLWLLATILFSAQVVLISTCVRSTIGSLLTGVVWFLILPVVMNSLLPVQLLIFPMNIMGAFRTAFNPGASTDLLGKFLTWRPWLSANKWVYLLYLLIVSLGVSGVSFLLAQKKQRTWA